MIARLYLIPQAIATSQSLGKSDLGSIQAASRVATGCQFSNSNAIACMPNEVQQTWDGTACLTLLSEDILETVDRVGGTCCPRETDVLCAVECQLKPCLQ